MGGKYPLPELSNSFGPPAEPGAYPSSQALVVMLWGGKKSTQAADIAKAAKLAARLKE